MERRRSSRDRRRSERDRRCLVGRLCLSVFGLSLLLTTCTSDRSRSRSRHRSRSRSRRRSRSRPREVRRGSGRGEGSSHQVSRCKGSRSSGAPQTKNDNTWVDEAFECGSDGKMIVIKNQEGKSMVTCRFCHKELSYNKGGRQPLITHVKIHDIHQKSDIPRATASDPTQSDPNPGVLQFGRQRTLHQVKLRDCVL